jgi:hypothetical protein
VDDSNGVKTNEGSLSAVISNVADEQQLGQSADADQEEVQHSYYLLALLSSLILLLSTEY